MFRTGKNGRALFFTANGKILTLPLFGLAGSGEKACYTLYI